MSNNDYLERSGDNVPMGKGAVSVNKVSKGRVFFYIIVVLLLVAGFGSAWYFYQRYEALNSNSTTEAQAQEQQEVSDLVAKVGKLIILPTNETPTIATVTNADQLRSQEFFANAENGDKLLAYTQAMEAILYRPSINKIVEVGPIIANQSTTDATASTTTSSSSVPTSSTSTKK